MMDSNSTADVAVVGLGRVGLPLALSFADRGLSVVGIDNDAARLGAVRDGTRPTHRHCSTVCTPVAACRCLSVSPTPRGRARS